MNRTRIAGVVLVAVVILLLIAAKSCLFVVTEWEQVVVTQFGRPVEKDHTKAGLYWRTPFIQEVHRFSKRLLAWDGDPGSMPTKDKKNIFIDVYALWRIVEPRKFLVSVRSETGAQHNLDSRIDGAVRDVVGRYDLIEVVRSSDRELLLPAGIEQSGERREADKVKVGREKMEAEILAQASQDLEQEIGVRLRDVRIKRINYVPNVQESVYKRMVAERLRIAKRYVSEAEGRQAVIQGETQLEIDEIEGDAYQKSTEIRGKADAEAIAIYAAAVNEAPEFFAFLRTIEAYKKTLGGRSRLVLTTDNEFLKYLRESKPTP